MLEHQRQSTLGTSLKNLRDGYPVLACWKPNRAPLMLNVCFEGAEILNSINAGSALLEGVLVCDRESFGFIFVPRWCPRSEPGVLT